MTTNHLASLPPVAFARTEIFVPFTLAPGSAAPIQPNGFWVGVDGKKDMAHGVRELLPHFRHLMSGDSEGNRVSARWDRFRLEPQLLSFVRKSLSVHPARLEDATLPLRLAGIAATVFPHGDGLMGFEFEWQPDANGRLAVTTLADALPVLRRIQGNHTQRFHPIWTLARPERPPGGAPTTLLEVTPAGDLHLTDIARALLSGLTPGTVLDSELGVLHTSVVLDAPPPPGAVETALFHLGHAAPTTFLPPTKFDKQTRLLEPRGNRRLVLTREGATALSWPASAASPVHSEAEWAKNRFFGVYRLLHTHVHAERLAISGLNDRAAEFANKLEDDKLLEQQKDIETLLIEVTRYTLSLTGEDCGGNGDHVAFFAVLRAVHRIPQQRDELRAEIDELRALLRAVENKRERAADEAERAFEREERVFQKRVSVFGFYAVPATIALGILGANLDCGGVPHTFTTAEFAGLGLAAAIAGGVLHVWSRLRAKKQEAAPAETRPRAP